MMNLTRYVLLILLVVRLVPAVVTMAQDGPSAEAEPVIVGEMDSESLAIVRQFLEEQDADVLAEDLAYVDRTLPEPIIGRDAYLQSGIGFYGDAFAEFFYEPRRYIVANSTVVVEFEFVGTPAAQANAGEATAPAASADAISVPMVGIFEVQDNVIARIDMFYDAAGLQYQLGYDPYYDPYYDTVYPGNSVTGPVGAQTALAIGEQDEVDQILEDPDAYVGMERIVRGMVGPALNDNGFLLMDDDLLDLQQEAILVIDASADGLGFVQLPDTNVLVSARVETFVRAAVEAEVGKPLDAGLYGIYEGQPFLLATRAVNLDEVATLANIQDHPVAFYGQTVTVRGNVAEHLNAHGFVIDDAGMLNFDPRRVLVILPDADMPVEQLPVGEPRVITGMIREFSRAAFESEYGFALDEALFAPYETQPVVVADSVSDTP